MRERSPHAIVTFRRGELVTLLPETPELPADELARIVQQHITYYYPDWLLTIGIGGVSPTAGEIGRYARRRVGLSTWRCASDSRDRSRTSRPGALSIALSHYRAQRAACSSTGVLGPLLDYDRRHKTDFVHTAARYLANNNSLQATARELFVHVNTAAYRLQRIQAMRAGTDKHGRLPATQGRADNSLEDVSATLARDAGAAQRRVRLAHDRVSLWPEHKRFVYDSCRSRCCHRCVW